MEYFSKLAEILYYLGKIGANKVADVADEIRKGAAGLLRTLAWTAAIMIGLPLLLVITALITGNGYLIGLAGIITAGFAFVLHGSSRMMSGLFDVIDAKIPGVSPRLATAARMWHTATVGVVYTIASVSLFYTILPFPANPAAFLVVTLALMGLWAAGTRSPALRATFGIVGNLFLILVVVGSCYWVFFPQSAAAYRDYLRKLDTEQAKELTTGIRPRAPDRPASEDGPRAAPGSNPISVLMTQGKVQANWGVPFRREPDRTLLVIPEMLHWKSVGLHVEPGDLVFAAAKGKITARDGSGSSGGPEGCWPTFMNQKLFMTCPYPRDDVAYNVLVGVMPDNYDPVTAPLSGQLGLVYNGQRHCFQADRPGTIHVTVNAPNLSWVEKTEFFGLIKSREYGRPQMDGSFEVAIWVDHVDLSLGALSRSMP